MFKCIILGMLFVCIACHKNDLSAYYPNDLKTWNECPERNNPWDSLGIAQNLIGTWERKYWLCVSGDPKKIPPPVLVTFYADGKLLTIRDRGALPEESSWYLTTRNHVFSVSTMPAVPEIAGDIQMCFDKVSFRLAYIDICDNYFIRTK